MNGTASVAGAAPSIFPGFVALSDDQSRRRIVAFVEPDGTVQLRPKGDADEDGIFASGEDGECSLQANPDTPVLSRTVWGSLTVDDDISIRFRHGASAGRCVR